MIHQPVRKREYRPTVHRASRRHAGRIVERAAFHSGVSARAILGPDRDRPVADVRAACAWLIRRIDGLPLQQIALTLGRIDHTTAMNMIATAEQLRDTNPSIRLLIDRILGEEK
ncbi:helix-turn-helix domain-containing protein [Sphingomonas panni]|uniref:helix-turn-helix domain-containing protein n=1 Tax=Sphingomonas panni TaxID=237612 RepID=UPI001F5B919E|nr:helix-turn-helix domain-containing protein [Sphingomonas panni]